MKRSRIVRFLRAKLREAGDCPNATVLLVFSNTVLLLSPTDLRRESLSLKYIQLFLDL